MRADRVFVTLQSVHAAVSRDTTPDRWVAAVRLCALAAQQASLDAAVPVVRSLLRPGVRPEGTPVPADISVFAPALALAGLLPTAR